MLAVDTYDRLTWAPNLFRIGVPPDGSCFFHSLLLASDPQYYTLSPSDRSSTAIALRQRFANGLSLRDFATLTSYDKPLCQDLPARVQRYYRPCYQPPQDVVDRLVEELQVYADQLEHPSPEGLKLFLQRYLAFREYLLSPTEHVGDELQLLSSQVLDLDIYLTTTEDNGSMGYILHDPSKVYQGRRSLILHKTQGQDHWEPVGRGTDEGLTTLFDPDDEIILQIRKRFTDQWEKLQG